MNIISIAQNYVARQFSVVPIPPRKKGPVIKNWQTLRLSQEQLPQYFSPGNNIGVLLGEPSDGLIDVDLDHHLAVELADQFLPPTDSEFGRASKRRSHRLYRVAGPIDTHKRSLPAENGSKRGKMIVELRSTGCQTVFPGSIHEEGEPIEWDSDGEPVTVTAEQLRRAVDAVADAVEKTVGVEKISKSNRNGHAPHGNALDRARKYVAKMPPAISGQGGHDQTLEVACTLFRFGMSDADAETLLREYNQKCDPQWNDRELRHKLQDARAKVEKAGEIGCMLWRDSEQRPPGPTPQATPTPGDDASTQLPQVELPGGAVTITAAASRLGKLLTDTGKFYVRGGAVMRMQLMGDDPKLNLVKPAAACSDFEAVANLVKIRQDNEGNEIVAASICPESTAKQIMESMEFIRHLPEIKIVSRSAVLIERDGQLVQITGYDRQSGVWAIGQPVPDIALPEAVARLDELLADFSFANNADKARAFAALLTPALLMGGLLGGRAPIDLGEADNSQAGKGYRNKLTAAVYGVVIKTITQQPSGGVGSLKESFDRKLVDGANFLAFDNFRGKLDLPALESFLTEDTYNARIPYSPAIEVDPRRIVVMLTSNRAEVTPDLANRSSCVRITKQSADHQFAEYPEGDILDHVRADPSRYLAAVFAVIRAWYRAGKPIKATVEHDFRRWARVLGWVVENIIGAGPVLEGHRDAQERISSPNLNWLRDVSLAVRQCGRLDEWMRSHTLLELIINSRLETSGIDLEADLDDSATWSKATRAVGRKLSQCFSGECKVIDTLLVERRTGRDNQGRERTEYRFTTIQASAEVGEHVVFSETPNAPECAPNGKPYSPNPPNHLQDSNREFSNSSAIEVNEAFGGLGESNSFGETEIDPKDLFVEAAYEDGSAFD